MECKTHLPLRNTQFWGMTLRGKNKTGRLNCNFTLWIMMKKWVVRLTEWIWKSYLIKTASFDRDILNPALARASTLNDASTDLNDLVLQTNIQAMSSFANTTSTSIKTARVVCTDTDRENQPWGFKFKGEQGYPCARDWNISNLQEVSTSNVLIHWIGWNVMVYITSSYAIHTSQESQLHSAAHWIKSSFSYFWYGVN